MSKGKPNKEVRRAAVAQISREMARPRQTASVRKELKKWHQEEEPTWAASIVKNNVEKRTVDDQTAAVVVHET